MNTRESYLQRVAQIVFGRATHTSDQQTDTEIWLGIQLALSHAKFYSHLGQSAVRIITKKIGNTKMLIPFTLGLF